MIEQMVYDELRRRGPKAQMRDIARALGLGYHVTTNALGRLKERGAAKRTGDRNKASWTAVQAVVEDRRQYNGGRIGPNLKTKIAQAAAHAEEMRREAPQPPAYESTLAMALSWQP